MHCGKLINQAEVLQKDLSKGEVIVQTTVVLSLFFKLTCQVNNKISGECLGSCFASTNGSVTPDFRQRNYQVVRLVEFPDADVEQN